MNNIDNIKIGEKKVIRKTISESDVYLYAGIVGDFHPNHIDIEYSKEKLGGRVAHGALMTGFASRATVELIGDRLTPPGYVAQSFFVKFIHPIYFQDTISTNVTIKEINKERRKIIMDLEIVNQHGTICVIGDTTVKVLKDN